LITSHFEKIIVLMHVVTQRYLNEAATEYPDAAKEIAAWYQVVKGVRWANFEEVKQTFTDADAVDGYVIFNIRHNRYRLVTIIHYAGERNGKPTMGHVYIRSFLTHRQYDNPANWDKEFGR
jgi:mRNA interferase HigB